VPFTRATTGSGAEEDEVLAADEESEFLEQPEAAGSTNSASIASVARLATRGRPDLNDVRPTE
jgi:hypothetical protein